MMAIIENIIFWIVIGAGLAAIFAYLQHRSFGKFGADGAQRTLSMTMLSSAVRILTSVGVLFLAFKTGLMNGLGCLIAFIIGRWLWLIILVKESNIKKGEA